MYLKLREFDLGAVKITLSGFHEVIYPQMRITEKTYSLNEKLNAFSHANVRPICNYRANAFKQNGNCLNMM